MSSGKQKEIIHSNISYYKINAALYDTHEQPFIYQHSFLKNILDSMPTVSGELTLLDFGTGTGSGSQVLCEVFPKGTKVIGIDVSPDMIQIARSKRINAHFQIFDGVTIPYKDKIFDGVLISSVLHHIFNYRMAMLEIIRTCREKSWILISQEPNPCSSRIINSLRHLLGKNLDKNLISTEYHQFSKSGGIPHAELIKLLQ